MEGAAEARIAPIMCKTQAVMQGPSFAFGRNVEGLGFRPLLKYKASDHF